MAIDLSDIDTGPDDSIDKDEIEEKTEELLEELYKYQRIMYAQEKYSILLILQGMDAAGKSSTIRGVFTSLSPTGCKVQGFGVPTEEEAAHDFLWRIHQHTPRKGEIQIFDRSHYEDVTVPVVKETIDKDTFEDRCKHINNFEELLEDHNTKVIKVYLHTSKDEQEEDLIERIVEKEKHWKHNDADRETRKHWDEYMDVYEDVFKECDKVDWNIVPADKKWYRVYLVTKLVIEAFESMDLEWPELETERFQDGYEED